MVSFLALYRGASLGSAELIAVSTDPDLISQVATALLKDYSSEYTDPAISSLARGRKQALKLIRTEAKRQES